MGQEEANVRLVTRVGVGVSDARRHALHGEQVVGGGRRDPKPVELRQVAFFHLVVGGQKALRAVVEPRLGQSLLLLHNGRGLADHVDRLKDCVDVLGGRPGLERQHHHRAAEEADLALRVALPENARQPIERAHNLTAIQHASIVPRSARQDDLDDAGPAEM